MFFKPRKSTRAKAAPNDASREYEEAILIAGEEVLVNVIFSARKTVSVEVHPNCVVKVRAPHRVGMEHIKKSLKQREDWVKSKLDHFKSLSMDQVSEFLYKNGEEFSYLGEKRNLRFIKDVASRVELAGDYINIYMPVHNEKKVKKLFDEWYKLSVREVIYDRLDKCRPAARSIDIEYNGDPKFRFMKRRWGSCSGLGDITFNYELGKTPIHCIDYVILHELCHLREMNHSKRFYSLMDQVMPNWKQVRKELNSHYIL